jgi:hypothetical protein
MVETITAGSGPAVVRRWIRLVVPAESEVRHRYRIRLLSPANQIPFCDVTRSTKGSSRDELTWFVLLRSRESSRSGGCDGG